MEEKQTKRKGKSILVLVILAVVLIVLTVMVVLYKNELTLNEAFSEIFSSDERASELSYVGGSEFAGIDDGFAVLSQNTVQMLSLTGKTVYSENVIMNNPILQAKGNYAVAYDAGGKNIFVMNEKGLAYKLETANTLISATVNDKGWLAVAVKDETYDGCVIIYNSKGREAYKWFSGNGYVITAAVSSTNKEMAAVSVNDKGSKVTVMPLDNTEQTAEYILDDEIALDIAYISEHRLCIITESEYIIIGAETGEVISKIKTDGKYLRGIGFGDGFAVIAKSNYQIGSDSVITVVDNSGNINGVLQLEEGTEHLAVSDSYFAVLSKGNITVYNKDLTVFAQYDNVTAEFVAVDDDGVVIAAGMYSAVVY